VARAFVGIMPPRDVLDAVGKVSWRAAHRPVELALPRLLGPRWTTREQWHLTLQFLGNGVELDAAAAALSTVRGAAAAVRLGGFGGFPTEKRATVVWLGAIEGARELSALADAVKAAMLPVVPAPDEREYHPHLTLARLARGADLRAAAAAAGRSAIGPRWTADHITLFESVSASSGHQYRARTHVALPGIRSDQ
jgi:RNA 2',3'-cyclic 3'-phosphodiesterase